jgi:peptidoglycan DL-endopeptidase CwlO
MPFAASVPICPRKHRENQDYLRSQGPTTTVARIVQLSDLPVRARRAVRWQSQLATRVATGLALAVLGGTALPATLASATSSSTLRAEATHIAGEIDTLNTKIEILSEEYDQASGHLTVIRRQLATDQRAISKAQTDVNIDTAKLTDQAVNAYVNSGSETAISSVISKNGNSLPLQQTYLAVASGNLTSDVTALENSKYALHERGLALSSAETQAAATTATLAAAQTNAANLAGQLRSTLSGVNGQLAAAVAAQEAAQQAAASQAAAAEAAQAAVATPAPVVAPAPATASSSGGGESAVHAAETQLGVPYVWAGATPGEGFDCSGLTMWSWGQAGVNLPHSAQAQYDSIEHVSLNDLQPGDLIFYADGGYIYHVVMYVGGGEVIQAQDTGTNVMYTSIPPGPYAAGRP